MYEIVYATTRLAQVRADDPETAKRRFARYALYDDCEHVVSDVELSFGDEAELSPALGEPPAGGSRDDVRAWLAQRDERSERFEVNLLEDPARRIDAYLRLLATNDPWRLEGHGSLGRVLSDVRVVAELTTFDARVRYRFDPTQYLDYLRLDVIETLDPARPQDSLGVESLVDVAALADGALRQIASSYAAIVRERLLTARYAAPGTAGRAFEVRFETASWTRYVAHRRAEPARFLPPPGWTSAFPRYDG